ncbi:response regulator [Mucilaginibacter terrae]|uniref:CheY-like chemotaxis protein n=1 Tax=Mucilaginibacter terrae TaxID=1955052 RepID=A0ABU3GUB5_9SPHI|nr:response regulator [Mucilaginibacter terrae]MDT3403368.1 CheY-like chemotaxis protein [Mucilaginibacter terrae]
MTKIKDLDCVLLIDDDRPTNFLHKRVIEKTGLEVEVQAHTSATDALEFLTSTGKYAGTELLTRPGIIFLDINMPGMNGWEFMEEYKQLSPSQKARIVVIMLTTSLNADDRDRALNDDHIATFYHKPLRTEMVMELVNKHFSLGEDGPSPELN